MTDSISAEQALAIIENSPIPMLILDQHGKATSYNRSFAEMVGPDHAGEIIGHQAGEPENHPLQTLLVNDKQTNWVDDDGTMHSLEIHHGTLTSADGGEVRFFVDISKQTALEKSHEALKKELRQHILTDSNTGLLNQRGIMLALEPQVARSRRYNSAISVIMVDAQTEGARDKLLIAVTHLLKDQLRWADLIGCSEEQNFILVLPETTQNAAMLLADKLKQRMHEMVAEELPGETLWVCCGVTSWRKVDSAKTLLKRCEVALSQARSEAKEHAVAL